jgi:phosphoglycolate phosphatase-like HAD superfamily hydrolase
VVAPALAPMTGRYRALVFDIGNTLVRTVDLIESTYLDVFARHGIDGGWITHFKRFAGRPKHFLFAEALGEIPDRDARVRACMRDFETRLVDAVGSIEPMPGAAACLAHVEREGWRIAAASGFPRVVGTAILKRFAWDYPVVCDEDVTHHRPAADPVLRAAELLGVTAAETIVIGDTPQDVASAMAAGALAIAVATGKFTRAELEASGPARVLDTLADLPPTVAALAQAGPPHR